MQKNNYIQKIRGICILLVILIHTLYLDNNSNIYYNIVIRRIVNFATAAFIYIAGYLTKIDDTKLFYEKKIKRILIPLLIWDIIYFLVAYINYSNTLNIKSVLKKIILGTSAPHLYYLYVLIQLFILAPLIFKYLEKSKSNFKKIIPLIITPTYNIFISIYSILLNKQFPLYNYWFFGWFSYYYLGILLKQNSILFKKKEIEVSIVPIILLSIIEGIIHYVSFKDYSLATSQLTFSNSLYSILICCLIYCNKNKNTQNTFIVQTGNYSFGIYLSHMLVMKATKKIVIEVSQNYFINIALILISTVIISYTINKIYYVKIRKTYLSK